MKLKRDLKSLVLRGWALDWVTALFGVSLLTVPADVVVRIALFLMHGWLALWVNIRPVRLEQEALVHGFILFPKRLPREEVVGVDEGRVRWLRGTLADGIVVRTANGGVVELPEAVMLGVQRKREWIAAMRAWASSD